MTPSPDTSTNHPFLLWFYGSESSFSLALNDPTTLWNFTIKINLISFRVFRFKFVDAVIENFVPKQNRNIPTLSLSLQSSPASLCQCFYNSILSRVLFNNEFLHRFQFPSTAVSCCLWSDIYELLMMAFLFLFFVFLFTPVSPLRQPWFKVRKTLADDVTNEKFIVAGKVFKPFATL